MEKFNNFMHKYAHAIAVSLISLALMIDIVVYAGSTSKIGFSAYLTVMFAFELILHSFLIFSLVKKRAAMTNVFMIAIKVFDAIFFAADIALRIDKVIADPSLKTNQWVINFISYTLSAVFLIVILVFFIANNITKKHQYWVVVKVCMLLTALMMFICSMFEIVNLVNNSAHWYAFLEPMYMCFLMLGMFTICHYIETDK